MVRLSLLLIHSTAISAYTYPTIATCQVFDSLLVRHWDTWNCYSKRNHLFLCPLQVTAEGNLSAQTDDLVDLMLGLEADCPPKPFGGSEEFSVSPDGQVI